MFIALNKDKNRIHISNVSNNEKYYCPICGEELRIRRGTINAHHFAHKNESTCVLKDGWNYDMSDWHYDWQNQFPVDNQEIVFTKNNKTHRADVFINNTVIEFQHSPITEAEFNDRNVFYNSLGYKVIWIFDVVDKNIKYISNTKNDERLISWKNPIRFLKRLSCNNLNLDIFLQMKEGIWYRQSDYKEIIDFQKLNIEWNIVKISNNHLDGLGELISDDFYSDVEIIDTYCDLKLQNKKKYAYKFNVNIHKLSDEIYNYKVDPFYRLYGYCPMTKNEFFNHKECHYCKYFDTKCMRCIYRFQDMVKENINEIYDIQCDRDGRIIFLDLEINNKRKKYRYELLPRNTRTLLEFSEKISNYIFARFKNTENGQTIQLSQKNMKQLISTKKCYGRLCRDEYQKAGLKEFEILNWNKPVWLLIWYTNDNYKKNNNVRGKNISKDLLNIPNIPTTCPKCGSMVALIDGGKKIGCSRYPKCNYIIFSQQN